MAENAELKINFTDNELKSIAVNAMGRASEAGNNAIMRIGLAINSENGIIDYPSKGNNAGFTIGIFQWDIGQKKNGKEIIETYNNSIDVQKNLTKAIDEKDIDKYVNVLQQNRDVDLNGRDDKKEKTPAKDRLDRIDIRWHNDYSKSLTRPLNNFFLTDEGYKFVMSLQERQYNEKLKPTLDWALKTPAVQNMSREDAVITLAAIAKVKNQHGNIDAIKSFMGDKKDIPTKDKIITRINSEYGNEVENGVKATVAGATLYNALSNDEGKLGEIFRERNKENPLDIPNFRQSPRDQLIDAMFRNPEKAEKLIKAVNEGTNDVISIKDDKNNKLADEAYTVGVKDGVIFTSDKEGKGYKLEDSKWKEFDNDKDKLMIKEKSGNWALATSKETEALLKQQLGTDTLSEEFKANLALAKEIFEISDEDVKEYATQPQITDEMLQAFTKELDTQETTQAGEDKDKEKDSVATMINT